MWLKTKYKSDTITQKSVPVILKMTIIVHAGAGSEKSDELIIESIVN